MRDTCCIAHTLSVLQYLFLKLVGILLHSTHLRGEKQDKVPEFVNLTIVSEQDIILHNV